MSEEKLQRLRVLRDTLEAAIGEAPAREQASLSKRYLDVLDRIEELEAPAPRVDPVTGEILPDDDGLPEDVPEAYDPVTELGGFWLALSVAMYPDYWRARAAAAAVHGHRFDPDLGGYPGHQVPDGLAADPDGLIEGLATGRWEWPEWCPWAGWRSPLARDDDEQGGV